MAIDWSMYPEITAHGGLGPAILDTARRLSLDVGELRIPEGEYGFWTVTMESGPRGVAVTVGVSERAFVVNAWASPYVQAQGATPELTDAVRVADRWRQGVTLVQLKAHCPFMDYAGLAEAFERGDPIEFEWADVLVDPELEAIRPMLRAARAHQRLGRMFPTVDYLFLLRLYVDPFDRDAGQVRIWESSKGGYQVESSWHGSTIDVATLAGALDVAAAQLPAEPAGKPG
jgi:hypothetical protein